MLLSRINVVLLAIYCALVALPVINPVLAVASPNPVVVAKPTMATACRSIIVGYTPEQVWTVVSNPVLLASQEAKVKKISVLSQTASSKTVAYSVAINPLLPTFNYTLLYVPARNHLSINFKRISGSFKSFEGSWHLTPTTKGTRLTYILRLDPGMLLPRFLVLQAIQSDLPTMLNNVKRVLKQQWG
jgi:ribosome-associated toxin RatA of RatAB toxin-antitoxin module